MCFTSCPIALPFGYFQLEQHPKSKQFKRIVKKEVLFFIKYDFSYCINFRSLGFLLQKIRNKSCSECLNAKKIRTNERKKGKRANIFGFKRVFHCFYAQMFLSLTELKIPDYFALKFHSQEMKWNQRDRGKKQHIFIYNDKNNNVEIYHKKIGRKNFMECDDSFRKK